MGPFDKFREIRAMYAPILPAWIEEYRTTGRMQHDPYLMDWEFTPIEQCVWQDIRCAGIPFYPQMPVLNYFIDFGNPFLKIGIECDGKQWHDKQLDKIRDERLSRAGWVIYRIPGHECKRVVDLDEGTVERHYQDTSEGLIRAIAVQHFGADPIDGHESNRGETLARHQTAQGWI